MFWGTVGNIAGVLATGWMTKYLGKRNLYIVSMIVNAITTAAYFMARPPIMAFLYAMNIIGGFASGPVSPLIWALYADTADYSEWKTGRRATGLVFSAGTFAQKMAGRSADRWRAICWRTTASRPTLCSRWARCLASACLSASSQRSPACWPLP